MGFQERKKNAFKYDIEDVSVINHEIQINQLKTEQIDVLDLTNRKYMINISHYFVFLTGSRNKLRYTTVLLVLIINS